MDDYYRSLQRIQDTFQASSQLSGATFRHGTAEFGVNKDDGPGFRAAPWSSLELRGLTKLKLKLKLKADAFFPLKIPLRYP